MKENKSIHQISLYGWPLTGGQEIYVQSLHTIISKECDSRVFQYAPRVADQPHYVQNSYSVRGLARINEALPYVFFKLQFKKYIKKLSGSTIYVLHYPILFNPTLFSSMNCIIISHGRDWNPKKISGKYRLHLMTLAIKNYINIICNDRDVYNKCIEIAANEQIGNDHIHYIPNCYQDEIFSPIKNPTKDYILVARNLRPSRGFELMVKGYKLYSEAGGTLPLIIAGGPLSGKYYEQLCKLINALKLNKHVKFIGQQPRHAMPALFQNAACSIVPSKGYEGTSISALESMGCGSPCFTTNVGGLKDLPSIKFSNPVELSNLLQEIEQFSRDEVVKSVEPFCYRNWKEKWQKVISQF